MSRSDTSPASRSHVVDVADHSLRRELLVLLLACADVAREELLRRPDPRRLRNQVVPQPHHQPARTASACVFASDTPAERRHSPSLQGSANATSASALSGAGLSESAGAGRRNRHVLLAVLALIGHGHGVRALFEPGFPQLLPGPGVEGAEPFVVAGADEHQPAGGHDGPAEARSAGVALALGQLVGDAERHFPGECRRSAR